MVCYCWLLKIDKDCTRSTIVSKILEYSGDYQASYHASPAATLVDDKLLLYIALTHCNKGAWFLTILLKGRTEYVCCDISSIKRNALDLIFEIYLKYMIVYILEKLEKNKITYNFVMPAEF